MFFYCSPHSFVAGLLAAIAAVAASGCSDSVASTTVEVAQPISFPHGSHIGYFESGRHRDEKLAWHLDLLGGTAEDYPELARGECNACHGDIAPDLSGLSCGGCHTIFQDAALRERREVRPCIGCHRQAWSGSIATIPSANVCRACHGPDPFTGEARPRLSTSDEEARLIGFLDRGEDIPWMQLTTTARNVHFSHAAHVRRAGFECTTCHPDPRGLTAPPDSASVFTMAACIGCHQRNDASTDCLTCHR